NTHLVKSKSQIAMDSVAQQMARNSQLLKSKSQIAMDSVVQQMATISEQLKSQIEQTASLLESDKISEEE
ncbi:hypothetical protein, partial [Spirulina sp. 06S082]|uniref:hypothetical protein n=1 Tax=Spirulina sp. 06S082 TaxID=3110248 RepID=UPI002B21D1FE